MFLNIHKTSSTLEKRIRCIVDIRAPTLNATSPLPITWIIKQHRCSIHGPLARYAKLRVRMRRECRERFPRHRGWAIPTCITARASRTCRDACRDHEQAVSFEIGGGGKRSRHSRRMRNLQFYVSGKRPIRHFNGILCICFPATVVEWVFNTSFTSRLFADILKHGIFCASHDDRSKKMNKLSFGESKGLIHT